MPPSRTRSLPMPIRILEQQMAAAKLVAEHDFRPSAIIDRLGLDRPIYRDTTNYGHFGRPGLPWEE